VTRRRFTAALAGLTLALALAGCGGGGGSKSSTTRQPAPPITIGTKNFPEQFVLGELYRQALEANGFRVVLKSDIGSSEIVDRALTAGGLDMYPEYTGVLLSEIAGRRRKPRGAEAAYRSAKQFEETRGFTLLAMTPFSDSNALAVTPAFARRHGLRSIGDLRRVPGGAVIGAPPEFRTRFEGLVGLRSVYGLRDVSVRAFKIGAQYAALARGKVQAAAVFTTDGQLTQGRYTLLADPRRLFAFQNVAPVIRERLAARFPKLVSVIDAVSAKVTTQAMREMNAAVALRGEKPAAVAARFLRGAGLMRPGGGG
jgi:osmoprotectant transport system substrate-binding protein